MWPGWRRSRWSRWCHRSRAGTTPASPKRTPPPTCSGYWTAATGPTRSVSAADRVGQRATESSQIGCTRDTGVLLQHELADQDLPGGDTGLAPGQIAPGDV